MSACGSVLDPPLLHPSTLAPLTWGTPPGPPRPSMVMPCLQELLLQLQAVLLEDEGTADAGGRVVEAGVDCRVGLLWVGRAPAGGAAGGRRHGRSR